MKLPVIRGVIELVKMLHLRGRETEPREYAFTFEETSGDQAVCVVLFELGGLDGHASSKKRLTQRWRSGTNCDLTFLPVVCSFRCLGFGYNPPRRASSNWRTRIMDGTPPFLM